MKRCLLKRKNIIEKDPPLAARLLKLANSAYYGFCRRISDISA